MELLPPAPSAGGSVSDAPGGVARWLLDELPLPRPLSSQSPARQNKASLSHRPVASVSVRREDCALVASTSVREVGVRQRPPQAWVVLQPRPSKSFGGFRSKLFPRYRGRD